MYTLGYNEFDFFLKWRIQTLWCVQNWNLRQIYKTGFFDFSSRFLHIWLQNLKVLILPKKIFFWKKQKRCPKTQNFTLISNRWKSSWKIYQKKVISKTSLINMSKSEESAFFRHIFANNFFGAFLKKIFNGFKISVKFCIVLLLFWFKNKKIFMSY